MPFSLSTLQKLAQLVQSSDESQAVAEKVGLKKDALTTLFEAQQAGEEAVEAHAASCLERLQKAYNQLTRETVLDWLNAVDATEAFDTPEGRWQTGKEGEEKIDEQAGQSTQTLHEAAHLETLSSLTPPKSLMETIQPRLDAATATAESTLEEASSLDVEKAKIAALQEVQTTANGSLAQCIQQPFSVLPGTMPFLFAVPSRQNDAYGLGGMGTSTSFSMDMNSSRVLNDTTAGGLLKNVPNLYRLVTGQFANTTTLTSFYQAPHIAFLQGQHHVFGYQELMTRYKSSDSVTNYPYAAVAVLELKNTNDQAATARLSVEGSADSSLYGAGIFTCHAEQETWETQFALTASHPSFRARVEIPVPHQQTTTVMIVTSALALDTETLCQQFLSLNITELSLGKGVIIDVPSVLSTTQGGV